MKKILIIGSLGIALLALGFFAATGGSKNGITEPSTFVVAELVDGVSVKAADTADFIPIQEKEDVLEGSEVQTSETGRASILYPNGTITNVSEDSLLTLEDVTNDGTSSHLALLAGSIFSKVQSVAGVGEGYEVRTPNMVAAVRGTVLAVSHLHGVSTLYVLKGIVEAIPYDENGNLDPDRAVSISAGEKIVTDDATKASDEPLRPRKIEAIDLESPLLKDNDVKSILNILPTPTGGAPSGTVSPKPIDTTIIPPKTEPVLQATPIAPSPILTAVIPSKVDFSGFGASAGQTGASPNDAGTLKLVAAPQPQTATITLRGENLHLVTALVLGKISIPFSSSGTNTITFQVSDAMDAGTYGINLVAFGGKVIDFPGALTIVK